MAIMQAIITFRAGRLNFADMRGQRKAPAIPDTVAVIERRAIATVPNFNSVRANRIAVPETVAMASERRNQARRKRTICRSLKAVFMVWKREVQAKRVYLYIPWIREVEAVCEGSGGPGRERSQREEGMVKVNQHVPTMKRTKRSGSVEEMVLLFDKVKRRRIERICTHTAAM